MVIFHKAFWLILALVLFICGIVGLLLPIIPQVPFFFGAAWSLTKASSRFENWLHRQRWYQQTVKQLLVWKRRWAKRTDDFLRQRQINWQWLTRQWQVEPVRIDKDDQNH